MVVLVKQLASVNGHFLGCHFATMLGLDGASERQRAIGYKLGRLLARGAQYVSTSAIADLAFADGVSGARYNDSPTLKPVSYGLVVRVLDRLRALGVLTWEKAHVMRFHGPGCDSTIRPVRQADGSYRLPPRRLEYVATGLLHGISYASTALQARLIGSVSVRAPRQDPPAEPSGSSPSTKIKKSGARAVVPIESASDAPASAEEQRAAFEAIAKMLGDGRFRSSR